MPTTAQTFDLAWKHHQTGGLAEAERLYRQVICADPRHADAWCFLGVICQGQGKYTEAETHLRKAVQLMPNHPCAGNCLGIVLAQLGQLEKAATIFQGLLRKQPNDAEVQNNLGLVIYKQGRWAESLPYFRKALQLRPNFADAHNNMGNYYVDQGNLKEGIACYDQAIRFRPDFADAYFNRATPRLLQGDFPAGWSDYEWRWKQGGYTLPTLRQPRWDGSALNGKTILLWAEQGLGDTLQFVRYAPLIKERGAKVILATQPPLLRLMQTCAGIDQLIIKDNAHTANFDVYAPLMSLPLLMRTTLATVPATAPYLAAEPQLIEHWRRELAALPGHKVGIAWQGNPSYRKDSSRSIPLASFEPLSKVPGIQLISLQKGTGAEQLNAVAKNWPILDLTGKLDEASGPFADTAAIMRNLDVVVTSDSAIAHLAGALGVRVWLALPWMPDFRWLMQREDCPWYPTMALFRQAKSGQWGEVFERMAAELY